MRSVLPADLAHELLQVAYVRPQLSLAVLDSSHQRLVGLLPGLDFDEFVVDRVVSVDRSDRLRVVRLGKARRHE